MQQIFGNREVYKTWGHHSSSLYREKSDDKNSACCRCPPQFMKIAPILRERSKYPETLAAVPDHTGQHCDQNMSHLFLSESSVKYKITHGIVWIGTLGYNEFLHRWKDATEVLTDSGDLKEETTALKIPCITMRTTTERPMTAVVGSNSVVGTDSDLIVSAAEKILAGSWKESYIPDLCEGRASVRIIVKPINMFSERKL